MGRVSALWRYPITAVGRASADRISFEAGKTTPWDRVWGIAHTNAVYEGDGWQHCRNFIRAAGSPKLMAVSAQLDEDAGTVTLSHPDRPTITVNPDQDQNTLIDWVAPLVAEGRPAPSSVYRTSRGITDSRLQSISVGNLASLRALSDKLGRPVSEHRFRANVWLDGLAPWEEFDWIGKDITIGGATFAVRKPIERCRATEANPDTGERDIATLALLQTWGHQDFTVNVECTQSGTVAIGDEISL